MNYIIKIIKSLDDSDILIDGVIETVKHEIKKTRTQIYSCFISICERFFSAPCDFFC